MFASIVGLRYFQFTKPLLPHRRETPFSLKVGVNNNFATGPSKIT